MSVQQRRILGGGLFCAVTAVCVSAGFYFVDSPEAKPEERPTPAVENLLPGNAVVYFGWDGQDAHQQAFEKTAAYEALYKTGLVDLFLKVITYAGSKISEKNKGTASLAKKMFQVVNGKGLSFAVSISAGAGPPKPQLILVLHEAAGLQPVISRTIKKAAGEKIQFTTKTISGRLVTRASLPAGKVPFALEIGWWSEGKHLVIVGGADAVSNAIAVARGKRPNITTNPLWKKYRTAQVNFIVNSVGWFDLGALRKMLGSMPVPIPNAKPGLTVNKIAKALGLQNVGAIVNRSGYDGRALRSETTLETLGKKTGLLALAAQKPISLDDLPPLPQSANGFAAWSLDLSKVYTDLTALVRNVAKLGPDAVAVNVEVFLDQLPAIVGFDLKKDLLDSLGNVTCVYADPGQGAFGIGAGAVIQVKDAKLLRKTLNDILQRAGDLVPDGQFQVTRTKKQGREIITLEIGGGLFNPAFVVDDKWMVIGFYPQTVQAFLLRLDGKLPRWVPDAAYRKVLANVPKSFTSITVSDPRQTYRMLMGLAPVLLPMAKMGLKKVGVNLDDFPIALTDLPPAELVTRPLFPNVSYSTLDGKGIHWSSRTSLPSIPLLGGNSVGTTAVLVALLLPAVQQAREAARRSTSKNNLKQIAIGAHNYHETYGYFPQGLYPNAKLKPEKRLSWMASILPFMEQNNIYRRLDFKKAWDDPANARLLKTHVPSYLNPGVAVKFKSGSTHYIGIAGLGKGAELLPVNSPRAGIFGYNRKVRFRDITDGTSNTMMATEASGKFGPWGAGGNVTIRALTKKPYINGPDGIGGPYRGGCHVLFADGRVRFISEKISPKIFEALSTITGGEIVGDF